jgi:transcriptional regulator with XRE-family HTH domain
MTVTAHTGRGALVIPEEIRRRRIAKGLHQVELADQVGIGQSYVSRIENGDGAASVGVKVLHGLAEALECDIAELMVQ